MGGYLHRLNDLEILLQKATSKKYLEVYIEGETDFRQMLRLSKFEERLEFYLEQITSKVSQMEKERGVQQTGEEILRFLNDLETSYTKEKVHNNLIGVSAPPKLFEKYWNHFEVIYLKPIKKKLEWYAHDVLMLTKSSAPSNRFAICEGQEREVILNKLRNLHAELVGKYIDSEIEDFISIFTVENSTFSKVNWTKSLIDLCFLISYLVECKKVIKYDGNIPDVIENCLELNGGSIIETTFKVTSSTVRKQGEDFPARKSILNLIIKTGF